MLAGLDAELEEEDDPDPAIHQAELEARVSECTQKALAAKRAGDTNTALEFLKEKKALDAELKDWIAKHPPGSWKPKSKKAAPPQKTMAAPAQAVQ